MIGDISKAEHIYIAVGYTDMRKQIDGLSAIVQQNFKLDPFSNSVFLFCGRNTRTMKWYIRKRGNFMKREKFGSRLGFILISAGCAIGLGNVWRFPYITGQYGGAAFVLIYLLFLLILGLPSHGNGVFGWKGIKKQRCVII